MKTRTLKSVALALLTTVGSFFAAKAAPMTLDNNSRVAKLLQTPQPVREFRGQKPWHNPGSELNATLNLKGKHKVASVDPTVQFPGLNNFAFLESPDGTTWFYTTEYEYKTVQFEGGYSERQITAYTFTIYDDQFQKKGTIHDEVTFRKNETRVASAVLDPAVTTKFFNIDAKPEVMVYLAMNTGPELNYKVNYYNKVYTIDGEKNGDNDVCVAEIEGRCVDAINASTDSWSEVFYLTFVEDLDPDPDKEYDDFVDFVNAYKYRIVTYKKAGWNGGPSAIFTREVPLVCIPGDTTDGIYFISKVENNTAYFIYSQYENPYFLDPTGFAQDESATPENNFLIDVYEMPSSSAESLQLVSHTSIEANQSNTEGQVNYVFYSIGSLAWRDDIDMNVNGTTSSPAFIVARDFTTAAMIEDVTTNFEIYNTEGKLVKSIAENTDGVMMLSDINGAEPQAMFVTLKNDKYGFSFTNIYSGDLVLFLDQTINGESISAVCDRVSTGNGGYKYAFVMSYDDVDADGNELPRVAWINTDGTLDRIDRINCGPNVARATINISRDALNPYLYDTDAEMEYAVLVGRYTGNNVSEVRNEFIIVDDNGNHLATFSEADGKGAPYLFTVIYNDNNNYLQMVYNNNYTYNIDVYNLPFSKFKGGDGTAENPYQIASVGDLQLIKLDPAAHYVIVEDFDAAGFEFTPISSFSGSLDGQGHTIYNLEVFTSESYTGIFAMTEPGAVIKNINFVDPVMNLSDNFFGGLVVGFGVGINIENVKAYNLQATGRGGSVGGLVGQATSNSVIASSAVIASSIKLSGAEAVGGLVGDARTGLSVTASAFSGKIESNSTIGGIIGQTISGDETIADCHVDAELSGNSNIGGIIGSSKRSKVNRCYVEGTIKANSAAGGLIGSLSAIYITEDIPVIVSENVVSISMNVGEKARAVHRIVGATIVDESEAATGDVELGLAENYAVSTLAPIDSNVEAVSTSTEGASLEAISREFLDETLGWKFGTSVAEPWHTNSIDDPYLYFESSFILLPTTVTVEEGATFTVVIRFLDGVERSLEDVIGNFICEYDNTVIEMTGNADMTDGVLTIEFTSLKIGSTGIEFEINGQKALASVNVVEAKSGVTEVVAPAVNITFDGTRVSAPGAAIEIYNTSGVKVGGGFESVATDNLARGLYIAIARNNNGAPAALKFKH